MEYVSLVAVKLADLVRVAKLLVADDTGLLGLFLVRVEICKLALVDVEFLDDFVGNRYMIS
jgi:hypothetical protein